MDNANADTNCTTLNCKGCIGILKSSSDELPPPGLRSYGGCRIAGVAGAMVRVVFSELGHRQDSTLVNRDLSAVIMVDKYI